MARISSILKEVDGVIGVAIAAEHTIRVAFDGSKTDQQKITQALLQGGMTISRRPEPMMEAPFPYR